MACEGGGPGSLGSGGAVRESDTETRRRRVWQRPASHGGWDAGGISWGRHQEQQTDHCRSECGERRPWVTENGEAGEQGLQQPGAAGLGPRQLLILSAEPDQGHPTLLPGLGLGGLGYALHQELR
jgi:hypothetical protein